MFHMHITFSAAVILESAASLMRNAYGNNSSLAPYRLEVFCVSVEQIP